MLHLNFGVTLGLRSQTGYGQRPKYIVIRRNIKINRMEKITFTQNVDIFKKLLRCNALFYDLRKLINNFCKLIYVQHKLIYENR